jgi:DUF3047 family protein
MMKVAPALAFALLAGCALLEPTPERVVVMTSVTQFSSGQPGGELPAGWRSWTVGKYKKATEYVLVTDGGRTVVRASADASASGLSQDVRVNPKDFPLLRWRWKVPELISHADNTQRHTEDSPVRLIVTFRGDKSEWPFEDRLFAGQIKALTGYDMPYATLMYIWENRAPVGTVIPNLHTSRVKMIVAESGKAQLGQWREEVRNVYEDYKRAFGEEPPMTRSVGIMTDTDNTGEKARAYYGDIAFERAEKP